jgi:hypothetical protein
MDPAEIMFIRKIFVKERAKSLKVLSSEMDPPEIMIIRQVFIKERGADVLRKICLSRIL